MGFLDFFKKKNAPPETARAVITTAGTSAIYAAFGENIYNSDVVQSAVYTIVTEIKKLRPRHIRRTGFDIMPVFSDLQRVLENPNELMSKSDFLEKVTWNYILNYNSWIYVKRENGTIAGLYPVNPSGVEFLQDSRGNIWVQMRFNNGEVNTLPYDSFIHIRSHYSVDDFLGGDLNGQPNNAAILKTLQLNSEVLDGVSKALKASYNVNGILKYNTMLDDGRMEAEIEKFEAKLSKSKSGVLGTDLKAEYIPLQSKGAVINSETLKFLDEKILRFYGVPRVILTGDYTPAQYEAFYQRALEPIIIAYSEAFTKAIFSDREKSFGNEILFMPKELLFMSAAQTLQMVHELGQSGTLYENEKRIAFGLDPLEELVGIRMQSLNYVNVDFARDYQLNTEKTELSDNLEGNDDSERI